MNGLARAGWVSEVIIPTRGRSSRRWQINPKLFTCEGAESAEVQKAGSQKVQEMQKRLEPWLRALSALPAFRPNSNAVGGGQGNSEINPLNQTVQTRLANLETAPRCGARTRAGRPANALPSAAAGGAACTAGLAQGRQRAPGMGTIGRGIGRPTPLRSAGGFVRWCRSSPKRMQAHE
jgi:hypothetical protein